MKGQSDWSDVATRSHQKPQEARKDSPQSLQHECIPVKTLDLDSRSPEL